MHLIVLLGEHLRLKSGFFHLLLFLFLPLHLSNPLLFVLQRLSFFIQSLKRCLTTFIPSKLFGMVTDLRLEHMLQFLFLFSFLCGNFILFDLIILLIISFNKVFDPSFLLRVVPVSLLTLGLLLKNIYLFLLLIKSLMHVIPSIQFFENLFWFLSNLRPVSHQLVLFFL